MKLRVVVHNIVLVYQEIRVFDTWQEQINAPWVFRVNQFLFRFASSYTTKTFQNLLCATLDALLFSES